MTIFHAIPIYKKAIFFSGLLIFFFTPFFSLTNNYSIVFIHIGTSLPNYLSTALEQARLFNQTAEIVLLANKKALKKSVYDFEKADISCITCESLTKSGEHDHFLKHSKLNKTFRGGFWHYTVERFYYLHEYMEQYQKNHVFHLEYDNMLYANLEKLIPIFRQHYDKKIGATFDNDSRCIPGFIYIPDANTLQNLTTFISQHLYKAYFDMHIIALFKKQFPNHIKNLPIIPESYTIDHKMISNKNHRTKNVTPYYQHCDTFNAVFDAAALGQYLGGQDPRNGPCKPGFINESCLFNPSYCSFKWQYDKHKRKVPYLIYKNKQYKIINLHIHSKKLNQFSSL